MGAAGGGRALLLGSGVAGVRAWLPEGPRGCTVARVSWARVAGAAGGAGPRGGGVEGVLVVCGTPALALRVWWSWHGVDVCGRWWLTGLQGLGAAVRWWWWSLAGAVLLVCPGGLGVGWCGVAGPGPWSGRRALLAGALAGPLTCLGLLGLVGVGGG